MVRGGDTEAAIAVGEGSLDRLRVARSPRALAQLRKLDEDLAAIRGAATSPTIAGFRTHLTEAVHRANP